MTIAREKQPEIIPENVRLTPSDLYSDEPQLETKLHLQQMMLLLNCLEWLWKDRNDFFATGNMTIYYSPNQKKTEDFRGPDFFVVLDTKPDQTRKSWVVWEEQGKYPNIIVEILSIPRRLIKPLKKSCIKTPFRLLNIFGLTQTA